MATFEGGGGSVIETTTFEVIDIGGGDGDTIDGMYLGTGGGDGYYFSLDVELELSGDIDIHVPRGSGFYSRSRVADERHFSQEGGHLAAVEGLGLRFPAGDYRVDLVGAVNARVYPTHKPGCNSAMFGRAQRCFPIDGGRRLQFAMPAAPVGEYYIKVTMPDGLVVWSVNTITLTFTPECRVFRALCRVPFNVIRPVSPLQEV